MPSRNALEAAEGPEGLCALFVASSLREHRLRHVDDDRTPQNSLDSATLEQDQGVGWTLRARCNDGCEARSCNRPLPRVAAAFDC